DLVTIGQWPRQADEAMVAHVAACDACADALVVAQPMRESFEDAPPAPVPAATVVWQRAQWHARQEAMRVASRPVLAAQAVVVAGAIAALGLVSLWLATRLAGRTAMVDAAATRATSLVALVRDTWSSALTAIDPSSGLVWTAWAIVSVPLLAVALALLLSTIADFA